MALDNAKTRLPSCEDLWEDILCVRHTERASPDMTLAEALEMLYIEKRLPPGLSEFGVGILIHAIYHHTKMMLLKPTRLSSWVPSATAEPRPNTQSTPATLSWLPTTPTAAKWRNSACDALDILHWHANSKVAKSSGYEHHTILHLHLARLIILTPIQSIQRLVASLTTSLISHSFSEQTRIASARIELFQWVVRDCYKARLSVIHCAALFWHVRRYSCDSVQEPFAVYISTLVLWAFSIAMQLPEIVEANANDEAATPDPSFCHLDRPLDDELVQLFVRVGHRMCPNISKVGNILDPQAAPKILREGHYLLTVGSQAHVTPGNMSRGPYPAPCFTWGIEESYAKVLADLSNATEDVSSSTAERGCNVFPWALATN